MRRRLVSIGVLGLLVAGASACSTGKHIEEPDAALPASPSDPPPAPPSSTAPSDPPSATSTPTAPTSPIVNPPGSKPPQFIVVAFDGSGSHDLWNYWLDVARRAGNTKMTFFLSGIYAVPKDKRMIYKPPGHAAGASDIGWTTAEKIPTWINDVNTAYGEGHDIGTHFNGHFCGPTGVGKWTTADWVSETNQFFDWITNISTVSGVANLPKWAFDPKKEIVGGRTPCLEGDITGAVIPAYKKLGFRYDTSPPGHLKWPSKIDGVWEFPLASLRLAGTTRTALAMDYNIYYSQAKAKPSAAADLPALKQQVYDTYWNAFQATYNGTRAPLFFGNHFERWNGGIYTDALAEMYVKACGMPDVKCVSYRDVADYLDHLDPTELAKLQKLPAQARASVAGVQMASATDPLVTLSTMPGVAEAVEQARVAVDRLHTHRILRRQRAEVSAEAALRGARASAALEGVDVDLATLRHTPGSDPVVQGALRASTEVGALVEVWRRAPLQVLARLHLVAATDRTPTEALGRPRAEPEVSARLASLAQLVVERTSTPAIVLAAVVHGEILSLPAFDVASGVVARAAQRLVLITRGLDAKSVLVPEVGHLELAPEYADALAGYVGGTPAGVAAWAVHCAKAVELGARESLAICEAMLRG